MPTMIPRLFLLNLLFVLGSPLVAQTRPVTGKASGEFAALDNLVHEFMNKVEATSATLAISKDGQLLHSRGFGWRDAPRSLKTQPDSLFRIASISKPFTAAAIRRAADQKKFELEDPMLPLLKVKLPQGKPADERVEKITILHLLKHEGGWDRDANIDVMFWPSRAAKELKIRRTVTARDMVAWGLNRPLDFEPGKKVVYSNFGYCLLGRVLESVNQSSYYEALQQLVLKPHGIKDVKLGHSTKRDPREVWYNIPSDIQFDLNIMDAHGGLIASAPAIAQFAELYHVTGYPRDPRDKGYGRFFGSLPGTTALMRQHPSGWNVVVLVNSRREKSITTDNDELAKQIDSAIEGFP